MRRKLSESKSRDTLDGIITAEDLVEAFPISEDLAVNESHQKLLHLLSESDRGCIVLLAARLENDLGELHKMHIRRVGPTASKMLRSLFDPYGPLSSFSAKISIAYAYGLIEEAEYHDLELLRKLRNKAAHCGNNFSFEQSPFSGFISSLKFSFHVQRNFPEIKGSVLEVLARAQKDNKGAKLLLVMNFTIIMTTLIKRTIETHLQILKKEGCAKAKNST